MAFQQRKRSTHVKAKVSYCKNGCKDILKVVLTIRQEKITDVSLTPSPSSCATLKKAAALLEEQTKGKHLGDVYTMPHEALEEEHAPHHGHSLAMHGLREAILQYESEKATASLQQALQLLQNYERGLPQRDAKHDYEY